MSRGGRPQALTTWEKRYAVRLVTVDGLDSAAEAIRELKNATGIDVCVETVMNVLREADLGSTEKVSKLALSAKNVKKRLEFAKMHKDWTVRDWEKVVFSDETKINRLCSDGIKWCWIREKKIFPIHAVKQTVKHGGGSLMLWSCLAAKGVGSLYKIEQTLNIVRYLRLLQEELYTTLINFDFDLGEVIFQQDNASIHKAKIV
jgi:hypothetical protein